MQEIKVVSEVTGSVWKVLARIGDRVSEDDILMVLESMKMEIPLVASDEGVIKEICLKEGEPIAEGDVAVILEAN